MTYDDPSYSLISLIFDFVFLVFLVTHRSKLMSLIRPGSWLPTSLSYIQSVLVDSGFLFTNKSELHSIMLPGLLRVSMVTTKSKLMSLIRPSSWFPTRLNYIQSVLVDSTGFWLTTIQNYCLLFVHVPRYS